MPSGRQKSRKRIALFSHLTAAPPASTFGHVSVESLLARIVRLLGKHHDVEVIPASPPPAADAGRDSDLWIVTPVQPPRTVSGRRIPILHLPLGSFGVGAPQYRACHSSLCALDTIAVSCTGDVAIFERLTASTPARLRLLPFSVDDSFFVPPSPARRRAARRKHRFGDDEIVFFNSARIYSHKNLHTLVSVFLMLAELCPAARLVVQGPVDDPHYFRWVKQLAGAAPQKIRLLDGLLPPDELRELYWAADVFVNVTVNPDENFGLSQAEAMACGLPVVCSDWGGLRDVVRHGVTGFRARTRSTPTGVRVDRLQLLRFCERLASDPALRRRMGTRGRERARSEYGQAAFEARLLALVAECTAPRRSSPKRPSSLSRDGRWLEARYPRMSLLPWLREPDGAAAAYFRIIAPLYATPTARVARPKRDDALSIPLVGYRIAGERLESSDPLFAGWVDEAAISAVERRILEALRSAAVEDGAAFLEYDELARRAAVGARALRAGVRRLVAAGILDRGRA